MRSLSSIIKLLNIVAIDQVCCVYLANFVVLSGAGAVFFFFFLAKGLFGFLN